MADTDSDIFSAAISDEPIVSTTDVQPTETAATQQAPVQETPPAQVEPTVVNEQGHRVPLSEHLAEREKRQAAERRAEEYERRFQDLQRSQQTPKQEIPDVLENPEGFAGHVRGDVERLFQSRIVNMTFEDVREQNPEGFNAAWRALQERVASGDTRMATEIRSAVNPGRALMKWHQKEQTLQQIGDGGLDKYRERTLDEALKDPAFRQRAMEAWRAEAGQQPNPPSKAVTLPSLNRTTGASGNAAVDAAPMSDRELFKFAAGS